MGGDKCGRLLAHKLRETQQREGVREIKDHTGTMRSNDASIAETFRSFYAQLYEEQPLERADTEAYLSQACLPTLTSEQAAHIEREIRPEEVISAIARLKLGKSPGPTALLRPSISNFAPLLPFTHQTF